jgi:hypothetical protein
VSEEEEILEATTVDEADFEEVHDQLHEHQETPDLSS